MEISKLAVDPQKASDGVWFDVTEETRFLVARNTSKKYKDCLQKKLRPFRRALRAGSLSDDKFDELINEAVAETILLDWEGLTEKGTPVPYSKEKALEYLSDPKYSEFREMIMEFAGEVSAFQMEQQAEDLGN